jgi:hypothetical protein
VVADMLEVELFGADKNLVSEEVPRVLEILLIAELRFDELDHGQQCLEVNLLLGDGVSLVTYLHAKPIILDTHLIQPHFEKNVCIVL